MPRIAGIHDTTLFPGKLHFMMKISNLIWFENYASFKFTITITCSVNAAADLFTYCNEIVATVKVDFNIKAHLG